MANSGLKKNHIDASASADSVNTAHDGQVSSWKRILKVLSCILSISWVVMLHLSAGAGGGISASTFETKLGLFIVTAATIFPIVLFMRGRVMYLVGLPFLVLTVWTLWCIWGTFGMTHPSQRIREDAAKLTPERARAPLIRMIEGEADDPLLKGALPYLRSAEIRHDDPREIKIAAWTCSLNDAKFSGHCISEEDNIYAEYLGVFTLTDDGEWGEWKATITRKTRGETCVDAGSVPRCLPPDAH
jgi:uncharacterized membrane protein